MSDAYTVHHNSELVALLSQGMPQQQNQYSKKALLPQLTRRSVELKSTPNHHYFASHYRTFKFQALQFLIRDLQMRNMCAKVAWIVNKIPTNQSMPYYVLCIKSLLRCIEM